MTSDTVLSNPVTTTRAAFASGMALLRKRRDTDVSAVDPSQFDAILRRYDDDTVFVHAGLSDINAAFDTNPYKFLVDRLTDHFESVLVAGFTPSFKTSGVFHRAYSRPEYGMFSQLFLDDAEHRTDDPLHSILVAGPYRFDGCNSRRSFGPDGCFAQLDAENTLYLNVGIPRFHMSQLHYIECLYDVPYVAETDHEGIIYYSDTDNEEITQTNFTNRNSHLYAFNRQKIRRRLAAAGILDAYDHGGLQIYATRARSTRHVLGSEIESDPYYLVS